MRFPLLCSIAGLTLLAPGMAPTREATHAATVSGALTATLAGAAGFGPEVKRRIMIGTYVLSHGYYDAYYLQAQKLRRMIADDFQTCFRVCDLIAGPVAPTVAWKLGSKDEDPVASYLADIFTLPSSLAGLPGMSAVVITISCLAMCAETSSACAALYSSDISVA